MSSPQSFPPPGAPPPEEPSPSYVAPPPPGAVPPGAVPPPTYAPGAPLPNGPAWQTMPGAAHKPGAIPLRPLTLGAIYDGAFRIIRYNPKATVGSAVLVTAVAMVIPVVVSVVLTYAAGITVNLSDQSAGDELTTSQALGLVAAYGSFFLSSFLSWIGIALVTGSVAHVVHAAAVGRKLTLEESWRATRGKRWRVLGLSLLVGLITLGIWVLWGGLLVIVIVVSGSTLASVLWGLASFAGCLVLMAWLWIRLMYLPVPALMLEPVGVFGAMARGWRLTGGSYWRTFGIAALTVLITTFAGSILATPFSLGSQIAALIWPDQSLVLFFSGQALAQVAQNAFVAPFLAAVATLQYIDLRMRKEAYDVELMGEAGLLPA